MNRITESQELTKDVERNYSAVAPCSSEAAISPVMAPVHLPVRPADLALTDGQAGVSLGYFARRVRRYTWIIAGIMLAVSAGAYLLTSRVTPLYESIVTLKVERRSNNGFIGIQALLPPAGDSDQLMNTQLDLVQSDSILRPAAEKYHLLDLEGQVKGLTALDENRKRNAPIKLRRLKVTHVPNTYILRLSYRAPDPVLAAAIVNDVAATYIAHAFDTRDRSSDVVAQVVNRQMNDLRVKMTASAQTILKFEKELNVIDPEAKVSMLSSRLLQLNSDFTAAQADRLRKQAVLDATKSGTIAAAEASGHGQPLERLVDRTNEARQQFATVQTIYGDNHPEYKKALTTKEELESQLRELQSNSQQRVEADYQQSLTREQLSAGLVAETRSQVDRLSTKSYEYAQLKREAESYKKLYEDLQRVSREEEINRSFQDAIIQVADPGRPTAKPASPNMAANVSVAFLLSGFFALIGCTLYDAITARLISAEDANRHINLPVLASVPKLESSQLFLSGRMSRAALLGETTEAPARPDTFDFEDAIRMLRSSLDLSGSGSRSLLVTSAVAGEGKSTLASGLAFAYAATGRKTLIIDADFRRPTLHTLFGASRNTGLADVLSGSVLWADSLIKVAREPLFLLPAGLVSQNSLDHFSSGFDDLLERMQKEFDLVIIDGPPLLGVPETMQLAKRAGGVLFVARSGSAKASQINDAAAPLLRAHVNLLGLVMNNVKQDRTSRALRYYRPAAANIA